MKKKLIYICILTLFTFVFSGCKTRTIVKPVEVEKIKIEYRDRVVLDSIYNRDTTLIYLRGDTVFKDVIKWRTSFKTVTDSIVKIDSIPYAVEVVKEVNVLTKWQKWRLQALNILGGLIGIFGAFKIGRLTKVF